MIKAKNTHKLSMKDASWIIKQATGNDKVDMSMIYNGVLEGVRLFVKDHPGMDLPNLNGSLAKRITGYLRNFFTRLFADKYMMNWLAMNRIDLSELSGGFRSALVKKIKSELNKKTKNE